MFASGEFFNSAGESDSSTTSPLSTDGSEAGTPTVRLRPRTRARTRTSHGAGAPAQSPSEASSPWPPPRVQLLQPLDELGVVGACRRGRRKGRRNRTPAERETERDDRRVSKNARERERVENVNREYENLRAALGAPPNAKGRVKKVATLNHAINYIKALMSELEQLSRQADESPQVHPGPSSSNGSGPSTDTAVEPALETDAHQESLQGQSDVAGTTNQIDPMSLICNEELNDIETSFLYSSLFPHEYPIRAVYDQPQPPWTMMPPPLSHYSPPNVLH